MIERDIVTIIDNRQIILMKEMDKIQIGHIETMWSIWMSTSKVGNHFFGVRGIAQEFPHVLRIIIALLVDQVLQPASLSLEINDIIDFILLVPILYDV